MKEDFYTLSVKNLTIQETINEHSQICDRYLALSNKHFKIHLFLWNMTVSFLAICGIGMIAKDRGLISNPYLLITLIGISCLITLSILLKKDLELIGASKDCRRRGGIIEKEHGFDKGGVFQSIEQKPIRLAIEKSKYQLLRSHLLIFAFLLIPTFAAGALLSLKVGIWLAVLLLLTASTVISLLILEYVKVLNKDMQEGNP